LVFIIAAKDSQLPALVDIRDEALREWLNAKRTKATDKSYQFMLQRYSVKLESN
jgi:hypothetical protein